MIISLDSNWIVVSCGGWESSKTLNLLGSKGREFTSDFESSRHIEVGYDAKLNAFMPGSNARILIGASITLAMNGLLLNWSASI